MRSMKLVDRPVMLYSLLGSLAAVLLLPLLLIPLNSDNDTYQAMAFAMDQGKGLPYIGSWDQNFPGIVFYHWLSIKLFGLSDVAFRIVDLLNQVAIALIAFAITRKYVSLNAALVAVPLSVILYLGYGFWMVGQRDTFATTWLLLALYLILDEKRNAQRILLAGACIALATFIRPTLLIFAALIFANASAWKLLLRDAGLLILGMFVTLLLCMLPWLVTPGGVHEFITATIHFNKDVYGPHSREPFSYFFRTFDVFTPLYVIVAVMLCATLFIARYRKIGVPLMIFVFCGAVGIFAMGKFHVYHYAIYLPLVAILFAFALGTVLPKPHFAITLAIALAVGVYYYPARVAAQFVKGGLTAETYERIANNLASYPHLGREQESDVIRYLKSKDLQPSDVEFFLLWPGLQWRSGYLSDSRFTTTFALSMEGANGQTAYQREWLKEVTAMLKNTHPKYLVSAVGPPHVFTFSRFSSDSLLHHDEGIRNIMSEFYQPDTAIAGFRVYRLNDATH